RWQAQMTPRCRRGGGGARRRRPAAAAVSAVLLCAAAQRRGADGGAGLQRSASCCARSRSAGRDAAVVATAAPTGDAVGGRGRSVAGAKQRRDQRGAAGGPVQACGTPAGGGGVPVQLLQEALGAGGLAVEVAGIQGGAPHALVDPAQLGDGELLGQEGRGEGGVLELAAGPLDGA